SLAGIGNEGLVSAMLDVPERAIVLIEDIDTVSSTHERSSESVDDDGSKLNLTTLLNVLDGPFAKEDRILIMTTNYPEKLDPALIRKSRVDKVITINHLTEDLILKMCISFLGKEKGELFASELPKDKTISAADLQGL